MTTITHTFDLPIDEVFAALADPNTYPQWLLGAKEMRSIDDDWPAPGSSFHHRVGLVGPVTIDDSSTSCEIHPPNLLVLEVRARPLGRARVTFRLTSPQPQTTEVSFSEEPIGAARILAPVVAPLTAMRNVRSFDNLDSYLQRTRT